MLTERMLIFLIGVVLLLPALALATLLWRRYYREDSENVVQRLIKNSTLPIAASLINKVIDFGFAVITLRYLTPEGNGAYSLIAMIVGLYFLTITNWGLNDLTVREVAAGRAQVERLFSVTLLLRWGIAVLLIPVAAALVGSYALIGNPLSDAGVVALILLMIHLVPAALAAACSASFQAFQRMEVPSLILLLTNIVKVLVGTVALLAVPDVGSRVIALAAVALGVTTLNSIIFLALQQRMLFRFRLVWDWEIGRKLLWEAFPLLLNSLLLVVFFRFDYIILRLFTNDAAVGAYDAAYKLINMTQIVPAYFVAALFPLLARYAATDRPVLLRTYRYALLVLQIIAWPAVVGVTILARELIGVLAGQGYEGAEIALAILIWYLPISYVNGVTQYVLIALRHQRAITIAFGISALFNLALNFLLIPRFGYIAAAILTVVTEVVLLLPMLRVLQRENAVPPLLALAWRPALAALLMGITMLIAYPVSLWLAILVGPLVYLAVLWLSGTFGQEERALVRRMVGRS